MVGPASGPTGGSAVLDLLLRRGKGKEKKKECGVLTHTSVCCCCTFCCSVHVCVGPESVDFNDAVLVSRNAVPWRWFVMPRAKYERKRKGKETTCGFLSLCWSRKLLQCLLPLLPWCAMARRISRANGRRGRVWVLERCVSLRHA